jgi:beta-glucosidase-like glycosyl hydrolase/serine/threonine protein kinase
MPRMPLPNGATFAGFTIVRLLGSGLTGGVYLADHPRIPRQVALKILRADVSADPEFRDRFAHDVDLAERFEHPNIVRLLDFGDSGDRLYLATEYVAGPDAGLLLRKRFPAGMPPRSVSMIVNRIAEALDYAHQRGVLHRHVQPANILLAHTDSDADGILLVDFASGRRLDDLGDLSIPGAAPEQLTGGIIDSRTDQYGLAASAFQLLTGVTPFADGDRDDSAPVLSATRPELAALDPVFARALADDPAARYDNCGDFAAAVVQASDEVITAPAGAASVDPPTTRFTPPPVIEAPHPSEQPSESDVPLAAPPADTGGKSPLRSTLVPALVALVAVVVLTLVGIKLGNTHRQSPPSPRPTPSAAGPASAAPPVVPPPPPPCGDPVALAAQLPLRDKLAQLLMVGVTGADDARAVVMNNRVGGIFIGSWTDLSLFNGPLRDIANAARPLPLAVSVDEEGGRVERLAGLIGSQPSPRVLAQTSSPQQVYDIALQRGRKMKELGITIDFAPVIDVTDAPDDTVIGDRSFGATPQKVVTFAGEYARGLREAGLLPVLKHFPGHGHGSGDSHKSGVTTPPLPSLQSNDLIPYRTLTTQPPVAVMVGHMQVPGLTGTTPASLSPEAYNLLRTGGYGGPPFTGLVFTDDLSSMAAINQRYGVAEAVLLALKAGADTALWITTDEVPAVLNRLEQAVNAGELPMVRVDDALRHVALSKGPNPKCAG